MPPRRIAARPLCRRPRRNRPAAARPMAGGNILFLCTGNSARSILAEALLNRLGDGAWHGFSAGSFPKGQVHPAALDLLAKRGFPTENLRSKSWDEFADPAGPRIDHVI